MVPVEVGWTTTTFGLAAVIVTVKVSSGSMTLSPFTAITMLPVVWPAGRVSVPEVGEKSEPPVAVPSVVAQARTTGAAEACVSVTPRTRFVTPVLPSLIAAPATSAARGSSSTIAPDAASRPGRTFGETFASSIPTAS